MPGLGNHLKFLGTVLFVLFVAVPQPSPQAEVLPYGQKIHPALDLSSSAALLRQAPDGDLWLAERDTGRLRVFRAGLTAVDMQIAVNSNCDGGLLDLVFDPDFVRNGRFYLSLVDANAVWKVVAWRRERGQLSPQQTLFDLGQVSGCRPGGAMLTSGQRLLWIATGDQSLSGVAQIFNDPRGKLLRMQTDGSIPPDNPDPTSFIYARGLRDPRSILPRDDGEPIVADVGSSVVPLIVDELNLVTPSGNYGWDVTAGDSGGAFDDPFFVTVADGRQRFAKADGAALFSAVAGGAIERIVLDAATESSVLAEEIWFDPDGDADGTPDPDCPRSTAAMIESRSGERWALNAASGTADLYRFWEDRPGPSEVSAAGSPFPLRLSKSGSALEFRWQQLDERDVGVPPRAGNQASARYRIWEGALPLTAGYNHQLLLESDGVALDGSMRSALAAPATGSRYYLVSAQGDNLEGGQGFASDGTARQSLAVDYCDDLGVGRFVGDCLDDFRDPVSGLPMKLIDYNPASPTYLQALSLRDFRGQTVVMEIAAQDCFWCELQGPTMPAVVNDYRARDFMIVTVMNASEIGRRPYADAASCAVEIADWASRHGETHPILCDVDLDGDQVSDVTAQYWHNPSDPQPCGGFGQNFFVDSGGVIFDFICSLATGDAIETIIQPEINAESCE